MANWTANTRSEGCPRISPLEPRIVEPELVMAGMSATSNCRDEVPETRFADALYEAGGFDVRDEEFDLSYVDAIAMASSIEV